MKFVQLVVGPAGCGKSTYCQVIQQACAARKRACKVINLDPAAEVFNYDCYMDIRELVTSDDVMEEMDLGPNGALVAAMEFLIENLTELEDDFENMGDDSYMLVDCPGQIELYTHMTIMTNFVKMLQSMDYQVVAIYCLDVTFINSLGKFITGCITCLSAMIRLDIPHVSLLTKCDLLSEEEREEMEEKLDKSPTHFISELNEMYSERYRRLHIALMNLLEEYSLVGFIPMDATDEDSIGHVLSTVDLVLNYEDNVEPKANFDMGADE